MELWTPRTALGRSRGRARVPRASLVRVTPPVATAPTPGLGVLETACLLVPAPETITLSPETTAPLHTKLRRTRSKQRSSSQPTLTVNTEIVTLHGGDLRRPQVDLSLVRPRVLPAQIADVKGVAGVQEAHSALVSRVGQHDGSRLSLFPWNHSGKPYVRGPDDVLNLFIGWYVQGEVDGLLKDCDYFLCSHIISRIPFGCIKRKKRWKEPSW